MLVCRSACAPVTSHYGVTGGPRPSLGIRAACARKMPVSVQEAVAAPVAVTAAAVIVKGQPTGFGKGRGLLAAEAEVGVTVARKADAAVGTDADALVSGFTAYDVDNLISNKLAAAAGETNLTTVFESQFGGVCRAVCDARSTKGAMDAGRRMLELCDNCWCRQLRPCTISPPYAVCIACMETWCVGWIILRLL